MPPKHAITIACLVVLGLIAAVPTGAAATSDLGTSVDGVTHAPTGQGNASFIHDGAAITLHPGPQQVIKGRTAAPPGTNVTVRLRSTDPASPFLLTERTTVTPDGRFAAAFDLREIAPPTNATATIRVAGERTGRSAPVEIVTERTVTGTTPGPTTTAPATSPPVTRTPTPATTPESVPGFGIVAGALAALAGLLAHRRR